MRRGRAVGAVVLAGLCAVAAAQDDKPAALPKPGDPVPTGFRAFVVVDDRYPPKVKDPKRPDDRDPRDRTRLMHDFVTERGLNPTVAVFARAVPRPDDPAAGLIKQLDGLAAKHKAASLGAFAAFLALDKEFPLDESRDDKGQYLREVQAQQVRALADALKKPDAPFAVPLGLSARQSPQVAAWGLGNQDAAVVLYNRLRVVKTWAAPAGQPLTDEQVKDILATTDQEAARTK